MTILTTVLTGVLWLTSVLIVVLVLLQTGKGGSLAGVFGGGGGADSVLGTRATSFLVKATVVLSVLFLVLCLILNRLGSSSAGRLRYETTGSETEESDAEEAAGEDTGAEEPARDGDASDKPAAEGGVVEEVPVPAPAPEDEGNAPDAERNTTADDVPGSGDAE